MSARVLLVLVVLASLLGAAEPSAPLPVEPLAEAPWYDRQGDTWRRVALKAPPEPRLDEGLEDAAAGIPIFAFVMYALVALAIGLLVAQLWRLRGRWGELDAVARGPATPVAPATISALPFAVPGHDQDPESALRAALAAGDLALAVVWLYAMQLLRLDAAGVIRLAAGKTNRAYLRETASAAPGAAPALTATVASFERSHFGHQAPTRPEVEDLVARHRTLLAALPAPEGAP
jgi:hypothetical protein